MHQAKVQLDDATLEAFKAQLYLHQPCCQLSKRTAAAVNAVECFALRGQDMSNCECANQSPHTRGESAE
jgi:hypothetical protein